MIENHPLKVYYPYGGRHFVLHYQTLNKGGHLILSKSKTGILQTFQRLLADKNLIIDNFHINSCYEINILAPPDNLCSLAKEIQYKKDLEYFFVMIASNLESLFKKYDVKFPSVFVECENYINKHNEDYDPIELSEHYNCKNCYNKIRLKDLTIEEFYNTYHKKWYNIFPRYKKSELMDLRLYSHTHQVFNMHQFMIAIPDFGHHARGVSIEKFEQNEELKHIVEYCLDRHVLFYFELINELSIEPYQKMVNETLEHINNTNSKLRIKSKEIFQNKDKKEIEQILKIFNI